MGAAMKQEKCYVYFLSYRYNRGHVKLRTVRALAVSIAPITLPTGKIAKLYLRVPFPDGMAAPIPTLCNKDASLMLGIYFGPSSGGRAHICKMAQIGFIWADQMKSCPLPPNLA